jgi:uncharacterized protein
MEPLPIIDMHMHAGELTPGEVLAGLIAPDTPEEYLRENIALLKQLNIRAVTSGSKDLVQVWHQAAPDRIIPGIVFLRPDEITLDWIEEAFKKGDLSVLGEIVTQLEGISPDDPSLEPIFALAERLDIPVGFHMGLGPPGLPKYRALLSNPLLLEEVLIRHPAMRLYVMHAAWPMLDGMLHLLCSYPQVYVDTGVIDWILPREEFYTYLRRIVNAGFGDRVMFGSDQMIWPQAIPRAIEAITSADFLSEDQQRDILFRNAARFLRLDK